MILKDFQGMSWKQARQILEDKLLLLVLSDDKDTRDCAVTIRDYGIDAGAAVLCAYLFLQEHGVKRTLEQGVEIYREILPPFEKRGEDVKWTRGHVDNLFYWIAWLGQEGPRRDKPWAWPIPFPYRHPDKKAGLANIMLWTGFVRLCDNAESNAERIVADALGRFFKEKMERMRKDEVVAVRGRP